LFQGKGRAHAVPLPQVRTDRKRRAIAHSVFGVCMLPSPRWSFSKQYQPETYFANGFEKDVRMNVDMKKFRRKNSDLDVLTLILT
jgi:hypothetical protein